jgi:hypothetical protein
MPACCFAKPRAAEVLLPNALAAAALLPLLAKLPTRLLGLLLLLLTLLTPSLPVRLNKLPVPGVVAAAAPVLAALPAPCTGNAKQPPYPAAAAAAGPAAAPSRDAPKPASALLPMLLLLLPDPAAALGEPASTGSRRFAIKLEPVGDCMPTELLLLLGLNIPPAAAAAALGEVTFPTGA